MKTCVFMCMMFAVVVCKFISSPDSKFLKKHNHHKHMIRDNDVRSQTELVSYDSNGNPFVRCAYSDGVNGEKLYKKCALPEGAAADMGVACYSLWHGNHLTQDCWIHQEVSLEQCQPRKCESSPHPFGVNFCCCFGHECNAEYSVVE